MNLYRWFPALAPRRNFESVIRELIDGLRDGSIILDREEVPNTTQPKTSSAVGPTNISSLGSDSNKGKAATL